MQNTVYVYVLLINSLKLLRLTSIEQVNLFPDFVDIPDEIIDSFSNAFLLLPELIDNNLIPNQAISNLLRINNLLESILSNPEYSTLLEIECLEGKQWDLIRELSTNVLILLGEDLNNPDINYI